VLDVTRLILTNESSNEQLCKRTPFAGKRKNLDKNLTKLLFVLISVAKGNIFEYVLQLQSSLSANQLLMLRFLCNAVGSEHSKQVFKAYFNEAVDALAVVAKSEQKAIRMNLVTCLIKYVLLKRSNKINYRDS